MQALVNELPDKTDQLGLKFISAFLNKISIATALVVPESVLLENNKLNQIKIVHKYQCKKNKRYAESNIGGINHHANAKEQRAWLLELETKTAISQQFQQMFHAGPRQPGELGRK